MDSDPVATGNVAGAGARWSRLGRGLRGLLLRCLDAAGAWCARGLAAVDRRSAVRSVAPGDDASDGFAPRVVVFCHFDRHGQIRDHTRDYVDALRAEAFDVVFVSNAGRLAAADLAWLRGRAARIVLRRNVGYDFAAWRDGMRVCGLPRGETACLLLANDSVYGPLRPLAGLLERMDFAAADVWSATDSWQHRYHLQSYFLAFGPAAMHSAAFGAFWRSVRDVRSKWWVVTRYEIGLTAALLAAGLRCRAVWPYDALIRALRRDAADDAAAHRAAPSGAGANRDPYVDPLARAGQGHRTRVLHAAARRIPVNPTADLWDVLIRQGMPFLKRELLRSNPSRVAGVGAWMSVLGEAGVGEAGVGNTGRILRDLERSLRNRSP